MLLDECDPPPGESSHRGADRPRPELHLQPGDGPEREPQGDWVLHAAEEVGSALRQSGMHGREFYYFLIHESILSSFHKIKLVKKRVYYT